MIHRLNTFFDSRKEYGNIFLRLVIGWRLIDGTQDNIFSWERMLEFRDFLAVHGTPFPLVAANVSVYAQFICGALFIIGWMVRPAAIIMIINFVAALLIAHIGLTFEQSFDAIMMLTGSIFFLFSGAGKISVDEFVKDRK